MRHALCSMRFSLCAMLHAFFLLCARRILVDEPVLFPAEKGLKGAATSGPVQSAFLRPVCMPAFQIAKFHGASISQLSPCRKAQSARSGPFESNLQLTQKVRFHSIPLSKKMLLNGSI
jgi:hypothetical protein